MLGNAVPLEETHSLVCTGEAWGPRAGSGEQDSREPGGPCTQLPTALEAPSCPSQQQGTRLSCPCSSSRCHPTAVSQHPMCARPAGPGLPRFSSSPAPRAAFAAASEPAPPPPPTAPSRELSTSPLSSRPCAFAHNMATLRYSHGPLCSEAQSVIQPLRGS